MEKQRSSFSGKIGFVLAAAGSAVGLGNLWRFPYLAAKYGGGIFLLVYIILSVTLGFGLMAAEIAIGRKTGQSAIEAFGQLNKKWKFVGYLEAIVPMLITPYYCVIGGWVIKYFTVSVTGKIGEAAQDGFFESFIGKIGEPIGFFLLFLALTAVVVLCGVEKGIEKVSKVLMPVLVILTLGIAVYTMFLPGAGAGIRYYLIPDFRAIGENPSILITAILGAMGQMFYSLSLAMGIMVTYGSYMKKEVHVESSVFQIEAFDTGIAFLAGMMIIPAVFALMGPDKVSKGPGLMFVALPKVFDSMPGGTVIGLVFFVLVLLAALTSSISLMEAVVSIFQDRFKIGRKLSCVITLVVCLALGLPSALGFSAWSNLTVTLGNNPMTILDLFDFVSNNVLMPIVGFLICIFVGYVLKPKALIEEIEIGTKFKLKTLFTIVIKYVAPICIVLILGFSVLDTLKLIQV